MFTKKAKIGVWGFAAAIILFVMIQLIPYGRDHTNPDVAKEPVWDSQATHDLAKQACFDCHSNETVWPWYSNIAPVSWLLFHDVEDGRRRMNFSDWGTFHLIESGELAEVINGGEMPPLQYLLIHKAARLSAAEKTRIVNGLLITIGH